MANEEPRYAMARVEAQAELARLEKLQAITDDATLRRIDALGVGPGWRCLEVGAGAGSIARALSERVGPDGLVVAADMDPRFLGDFPGPGREVVTHDITTGPVPPADFDFVHCRAVLAHVADMPTAARNVVACARPGGLVLCEEPEYGVVAPCDPDHPRAPVFQRYVESMRHGNRMDPHAGSRLHDLLLGMDLEDLRNDGTTSIACGGGFNALYRKHTMQNARELAIASGTYTEASFQALMDCFEDPTFRFIDTLWVGVSARVPR